MISRTVDTPSFHYAAFGPAMIAALVGALFAAILLIGLMVPLHCAHGGIDIFAMTAVNAV